MIGKQEAVNLYVEVTDTEYNLADKPRFGVWTEEDISKFADKVFEVAKRSERLPIDVTLYPRSTGSRYIPRGWEMETHAGALIFRDPRTNRTMGFGVGAWSEFTPANTSAYGRFYTGSLSVVMERAGVILGSAVTEYGIRRFAEALLADADERMLDADEAEKKRRGLV